MRGWAYDSPGSRPSAWGGGWGGAWQKEKTFWRKKWRKDHNTHRWMSSRRGRYFTLQIQLQQGTNEYNRLNMCEIKKKKNLQIIHPNCCRSVQNLRLTLWASTMPAWICLGYSDVSCCPQKSPFETKSFVKTLDGKGDSHVLCRLLFTFQKRGLTVQKYAVTDWQSICLMTQNMGIMTVAVTRKSHIPTFCVKAEQKKSRTL